VASSSSSARQALEALGGRLREIRMDAGLTGRDLSRLTDWHSSKVSKIEHGKQTLTAAEIKVWCQYCEATEQIPDLIATVRAVESAYVEWRRLQRTGLRQLQEVSTDLYKGAAHFRIYQPSVIPGLFQTAGYAAALLGRIANFHETPDDTSEAVAARLERQRLLSIGDRRFAILIEESVLRYQIGRPDVMLAQLGHLIGAAALPAVSLGIIPFGAPDRPHWAVQGFSIFDDARINVELLTARVTVTQPREIALYIKAFATLAGFALYGAAARARIMSAIETLDTGS
jgi:transcriptional regulator with XRE-family HTH domain